MGCNQLFRINCNHIRQEMETKNANCAQYQLDEGVTSDKSNASTFWVNRYYHRNIHRPTWLLWFAAATKNTTCINPVTTVTTLTSLMEYIERWSIVVFIGGYREHCFGGCGWLRGYAEAAP